MALRQVSITVDATPKGSAYVFAYGGGGLYEIPTYTMTVSGMDNQGGLCEYYFRVIRFGPMIRKPGTKPRVVGLAEGKTYGFRDYNPKYELHCNQTSAEKGAWKIAGTGGNHYIHDGPDDPHNLRDLYATKGCIEICGVRGWQRFNDALIALSGATGERSEQLNAIKSSAIEFGTMKIIFQPAVRPTLKPVSSNVSFQDPNSALLCNLGLAVGGIGVQGILDSARDLFRNMMDYLGFTRRDPLILDLNGDGIRTTGVQDGPFFDHDRNGMAELTGWADPDDGLLAMDRNGDGVINDGSELFGDQTVLRSGRRALSAFEALAELDSNGDGKIDAEDSGYSRLRVWADSDGDGLSLSTELHTLDELGIRSISLSSAPDAAIDPQGNTRNRIGSFQLEDGTIRTMGEYTLQRDLMYTIAAEWLEEPEDIADLPDLWGYGALLDLHQAMIRDESGQLRSLVEQFSSATDPTSRAALMQQILFKWTGCQEISPTSRGGNIDARRLAVLEKFFGQSFIGTTGPNPGAEPAVRLNESYRMIFEMNYALLMGQTHLRDLYGKVVYTWDGEKQQYSSDFSPVITELQAQLSNNAEYGRLLLSEFARSLRGLGHDRASCLSCREFFIQMDPSLAWVIDTGGLPVYEHVGQGLRTTSPHIEGTDNADAIRGSLTEGDRFINGLNGNDVIEGTSRDEILINETGDALLVAGGGNDQIWAGAGNDILDGGTGNDILMGEAGNDTYIFRPGAGQDTIIDTDPTAGNVDTIWLGGNLSTTDVYLRRSGNDLVLKIIGSSDRLAVRDFFKNDSTLNRVERIQFMDGTVWDEAEMISRANAPTQADDVVYGGPGNDTISALAGNDTAYGLGGDDEKGVICLA